MELISGPEEERKNFPNPQGGFYDKKIDVENSKLYDEFIQGMSEINELLKQKVEDGGKETTL